MLLLCSHINIKLLSCCHGNVVSLPCCHGNVVSLRYCHSNIMSLHCCHSNIVSLSCCQSNITSLPCWHSNIMSLHCCYSNIISFHCCYSDIISLPVVMVTCFRERTCINPAYAPPSSASDHAYLRRRVGHMTHRSSMDVDEGSSDSASYPPKGSPPEETRPASGEGGGRQRGVRVKGEGEGQDTPRRLMTRAPAARLTKTTAPPVSVTCRPKWSVQCSSDHRLNVDFMVGLSGCLSYGTALSWSLWNYSSATNSDSLPFKRYRVLKTCYYLLMCCVKM